MSSEDEDEYTDYSDEEDDDVVMDDGEFESISDEDDDGVDDGDVEDDGDDYADEEERNNTYQKLLRSPKHFLMQPKCTDESYFILDIDNEEGFDRMGEALRMMEEVGAEEMLRYPTKNGWHFVVKPFNPNLWLGPGEIKKDGLLLLSY